jgi:hypothetical protein
MTTSKGRKIRKQLKNWTCNHFSITDHKGDATKLLRKVAAEIRELGKIEVLDIVFRSIGEPSFEEITVTVYFSYPPAARAKSSSRGRIHSSG